MKDQFVTYEIALKFKQLGFNDLCFGYFNGDKDSLLSTSLEDKKFILGMYRNNSIPRWLRLMFCPKKRINICAAPLWQEAINWLKTKHKLEIEIFKWSIKCYHDDELALPHYVFDIDVPFEYTDDWVYQSVNDNLIYHTYEEAREAAILKAIELCQKEK